MLSDRPMRLAPPRAFHLVGSIAVLVSLLATRGALAQAVTGIPVAPQRLEPDGTSADALNANPHPGGVPVNAINYEDCAADLRFKFTLNLAELNANAQLVAYAGPTDCTAASARIGTSPTCWSLTPDAIPQAAQTTVTIHMRDLAADAPLSPLTTSAYPNATSAACVAQTTSAGNSIFIYFFFVDGNGNAVGVAQAYPITVDTQASDVNGSIKAIPADGTLSIGIPTNTDPDITGWNAYCDPPAGEETEFDGVPSTAPSNGGMCVDAASTDANSSTDATSSPADGSLDATSEASDEASSDAETSEASSSDDAGAADAASSVDADAGADAQSSSQASDAATGNPCGASLSDAAIPGVVGCQTSSVFAPTVLVTTANEAGVTTAGGHAQTVIPLAYRCGQGLATDTSVTVTGLKDGYFYEVALAATDAVGNVGPLAVTCGEPLHEDDFFNYYWAQNGRAGGGYCSTDGAGAPGGTSAFGVLFAAGCAAAVRRKRRRA
jgi:hypothetical protein